MAAETIEFHACGLLGTSEARKLLFLPGDRRFYRFGDRDMAAAAKILGRTEYRSWAGSRRPSALECWQAAERGPYLHKHFYRHGTPICSVRINIITSASAAPSIDGSWLL